MKHKNECVEKLYKNLRDEFRIYTNKVGYDKFVDYEHAHRVLFENIKKLEECYSKTRKKIVLNHIFYLCVLFTQLENATRISESVDAMLKYIKTNAKIVNIRVRKKKKYDEREVVIPKIVENIIQKHKYDFLKFVDNDFNKLVNNTKKFASRVNINTHSLRYARITFFVKQNIPVSIIAKITHHSNLNYVLYYTQKRIAHETLLGVVK